MIGTEVQVDPERLLVVTTGDEHRTDEFVVVTCRYAPVTTESGGRVVAIELTFDPLVTQPREAYYAPTERLERVFFSPAYVKRIRPYSAVAPVLRTQQAPSPETKVAIAYATALRTVAAANGLTLSAYFEGARLTIERGDRASVEPNLNVLVEEFEKAAGNVGVWADTANRDRLLTNFKQALPNASPRDIAMAARLLAWYPGGDAATYAATWDTRLPHRNPS